MEISTKHVLLAVAFAVVVDLIALYVERNFFGGLGKFRHGH